MRKQCVVFVLGSISVVFWGGALRYTSVQKPKSNILTFSYPCGEKKEQIKYLPLDNEVTTVLAIFQKKIAM